MRPGPSGAPGSVSSSPVMRTATRGLPAQRELAPSDGRRDAQLGGAQLGAGSQNDGIEGDVLAGAPNIRARVDLRHADAIVSAFAPHCGVKADTILGITTLHRRRSLDRNHGIRALRHQRPR